MAVTDVLSLDEFVDLYKILEIAPTATEAELRERVNKLFLEAQRNLDHHNFRKRFYYQQLNEVHLPQAHQLLLNPAQREEYDRYLEAFNQGLPFPDAGSGPSVITVEGGELGRADHLPTDMLPTVGAIPPPSAPPSPAPSAPPPFAHGPAAPASSPGTQPAPKTESRFNRESAPPSAASPSNPPPSAAPPSSASPSTARRPAAPPRPSAPASRPSITPPSTPGTTVQPPLTSSSASTTPSRPSTSPAHAPLVDVSEAERRRDFKRRELIKRELVSVGKTWGLGVGLGSFVVLTIILLLVLHSMEMLSNTPVLFGGLATVNITAVLIGRYALREARRRIVVVLSKMPYDELLRRCAR